MAEVGLAVLGALNIGAESKRPISGSLVIPKMDPLADKDSLFVLDFSTLMHKAQRSETF